MKLTLGADPEVCLFDVAKKAYVSAHDLIPGTKDKPFKVKKGAVQVDGTALEFNIDPASSSAEFVDHLDTVLGEAKAMLPKDVELRFDPVVEYPEKYFKDLPSSCKALGCDPDYEPYKGRMNPIPRPYGTMRTFGGHIHLGWGKGYRRDSIDHFWDCRQMSSRLADYFQEFAPFWDTDTRRTRMYGSMGAFRPKTFGVEFRSLSNAWLGHRILWPWIFDSCQWIFNSATQRPVTWYSRGHTNAHYRVTGFNGQPYQFYHDFARRKAAVSQHITASFGAGAPPFPKDFEQAPLR